MTLGCCDVWTVRRYFGAGPAALRPQLRGNSCNSCRRSRSDRGHPSAIRALSRVNKVQFSPCPAPCPSCPSLSRPFACLADPLEFVTLPGHVAQIGRGPQARPTCHFQSRYLSLTCHFDTCISPNVYRPPVTLSPPVTPWVSLPSLALALDPDPLPTLPRSQSRTYRDQSEPIGPFVPLLSRPFACFADPLEFVTLASVT